MAAPKSTGLRTEARSGMPRRGISSWSAAGRSGTRRPRCPRASVNITPPQPPDVHADRLCLRVMLTVFQKIHYTYIRFVPRMQKLAKATSGTRLMRCEVGDGIGTLADECHRCFIQVRAVGGVGQEIIVQI